MRRLLRLTFRSGVKRCGELRRDLSLETGVHYLSFLYLGVLLRWLNTPDLNLSDEFDGMLTLFLDGLSNGS